MAHLQITPFKTDSALFLLVFALFCHFNHHICSNIRNSLDSTWSLVHVIIISTFWLLFKILKIDVEVV